VIPLPDLSRAAELIDRKGISIGKPLHVAATTGSTNDDAKAGARAGAPHGSVWVAETQSRGRGRHGRSWVSPPGENLLFSVLVRLGCEPARVPPLALVCGLAVRDAVAKSVSSDRVRVKWPNDVVVESRSGGVRGGHRKIAGVLVESSVVADAVEHVVIGIGLNVHTRTFPPELASIATSVGLESEEPPDRAELLADILESLDRDIEHVARRGLGLVHARLTAHDVLRGRAVDHDGAPAGVACGIDHDGCLLVRGEDGVVAKIVSGEVRALSPG
jgi:BirA family biotin operon repressor/biotin-[acetyl-CoA-carboxylase] ligase